MTVTPRTLTAMQRGPTSYEIGVYRDGELVEALGFTVQRNKHALLHIMRQHGERILALCPDDSDQSVMIFRAGVWHVSEHVTVKPTGRTEREVASADGRI